MKHRCILLWLWLGVTAIILAMVAVTALWHRERREIADRRLTDSLQSRLVPLQSGIDAVLRDEGIALTKLLEPLARSSIAIEDCSAIRHSPDVENLIVWNRTNNRVLFPDRVDALTEEQREIVRQGLKILREESRLVRNDESSTIVSVNQIPTPPPLYRSSRNVDAASANKVSTPGTDASWVAWYQDRRMRLALIRPINEELWAMIIPPSTRIVSKIVTVNNDNFRQIAKDSLIQLRDANGNVVHQGGIMTLQSTSPFTVMPLAAPLDSWNLAWFGDATYRRKALGDDPFWLAVLALGSLASLLVIGASVVSYSLGRQLRLAEQRVSFVNQVSHELRTPLTNIAMYTDLLEQELRQFDAPEVASDEQSRSLQKVRVIRDESERLNRLIRNVLEFGRSRRRIRHNEIAVLDDILRQAASLFDPRFSELGLQIEFILNANRPAMLDTDIVEQIAVNFLSNAEKYASQGKKVWIHSEQTKQRVAFRVIDAGPGVAHSDRAKIFRPFVRLDDSISAPTGSGIGLSVARELAVLHGGDCRIEESIEAYAVLGIVDSVKRLGACFRCDLEAPMTRDDYDEAKET